MKLDERKPIYWSDNQYNCAFCHPDWSYGHSGNYIFIHSEGATTIRPGEEPETTSYSGIIDVGDNISNDLDVVYDWMLHDREIDVENAQDELVTTQTCLDNFRLALNQEIINANNTDDNS